MKKLICLLAALLIALCLPALAEESEWDFDADYCELNGYGGTGGSVVVPGEMAGSTVDVIQANVFSSNDTIATLKLPDTLLQLKDSAIYWCEKLTAVDLPDSLIAVGERNLFHCPELSEITIPAGVRFIGEESFSDNDALRRIVFKGVCPVIGSGCFTDLPENAVIYVPDDQLDAYQEALRAAGCAIAVQPSGESAVAADNNGFDEADFEFDAESGTIIAYKGCATYLSIPETIGGAPVKAIGDKAFEFNYYLTVLELPEGLEHIGDGAFAHCETIQYVSFPDSLKHIGADAFNGSYKARTLKLANVESIGDGAFGFSRITGELTLPEGLTAIGANAFESNFYLAQVNLPASLESVGDRAFGDDWSLSYVVMDSLTPPALGENAFAGCTALADLDLNEHSTRAQALDVQAYMDAQGLSCYVWRAQNSQSDYPEDGTAVYENGLMIAYTGTQTRIHPDDICDHVPTAGIADGLFKDNQTLEYFAVPHSDKFTTIGAEAFMNSAIQGVDLFDSVTTIGARAFANCAQLKELTIPESATEIGTGAFEGLTGLEKLTILCDASLIPEGSFTDCPNLTDVRLAANASDEQVAEWNEKLNRPWYDSILRVGEISRFAAMPFASAPEENFEFNPETGLISAYIGADIDVVVPREIGGVTVVGFENDAAFEACRDYTNTETASNQTSWVHLRTLVLPETIREIPDGLLNYCQQLETFICYAPLESTGKSTFALCRSLKTVAFMNGVRVIDSYTFDSTDALENLYFGSHVQKIAANAFNLSGLKSLVIDADEIETGAFTACPNLTSLHFTEKVKTIGETFAAECPNLSELCFECELTNDLLLLNAAPQLTVRIPEDADEDARSYAQNCMSWSENPSEVTVTVEKCAHALPERPDIAALLPELKLDEIAEPASQGEAESIAAPAPEAQSAAIPEDYLGTWYGVNMDLEGTVYSLADLGMDAMLVIHAGGEAAFTMDGETDSVSCIVQNGALMLEGATLTLENGSLVYAEDGMIMTLSREKPEALETAPIDESATIDSFKGEWTAVSVTADGATIPAESADMGGDTLRIYGDSCDITLSGMTLEALPCRMDGSALLISILDGESAAVIRTDGTLTFELDEMAIWYERIGDTPETPAVAAKQPTEAPIEQPALQEGMDAIAEIRFVMTDADMNGYSMTPEALGGYEYSIVFHADGTVDFVMAGTAIPMLKWTYGKVPAPDGGEIDGMIIDFSGQPLNVIPTKTGFDMDYFGTMLMHFAPEESRQ